MRGGKGRGWGKRVFNVLMGSVGRIFHSRNLKEIPQTYEDLNYELIQLLECPICFEYSTPPINQCLQGHIICSNCRQRVSTCPTCRNMFQESRNLVMEKVKSEWLRVR